MVALKNLSAEAAAGEIAGLSYLPPGAPDVQIARELARTVVGSSLVKASIFGADPNWGRVLAAIGARVGTRHWPVDPTRATVLVQGTCVYADAPTGAFRHTMDLGWVCLVF